MPQFISLPSGLVVNLDLVNRMVPIDEQGEPALTLHFSTGDFVTLDSTDTKALRKRAMIPSSTMSPNVKTTVFWIVILMAVVMVWLAVHAGR